ncbi:TPA: fimbria/pilus periplasmic chaperone [Providencia alcalifaciens]
MNRFINNLILKIFFVSFSSYPYYAAMAQNTAANDNFFGVELGATRVIYDPTSSGATLAVKNNQNYPMLVQSQVFAEDAKSKAPFTVTPPIFRLDGQQTSRIRIIRTGGDFPKDRETLQWLCVKGIPPEDGDEWAKSDSTESLKRQPSLAVKFSVSNCIKLFVRPNTVKGHPEDVAGKVTWEKQGRVLKGSNPTPFYINLTELKVGKENIKSIHYIPPFGSYSFELPVSSSGDVQWKIVTDYGGESELFKTALK